MVEVLIIKVLIGKKKTNLDFTQSTMKKTKPINNVGRQIKFE